jgi:hypothetical protein
MSHIVEIQTQVRDEQAARAACRRLELPEPTVGVAKLFSSEASGLIVSLPGWRYPAVFELATGQARCDTFNGRWGDERQLHRFLQSYAVERATAEARRQGHSVSERLLADGSVRLTVHVHQG